MRSSLCLCSSLMPTATGTGHDAAVQAGPERVDELLVARDVQDQEVAGLGADALQVMQDAERAAAQLGERQRLFGSLALEVADRARAAAAVVEHFRERLVLDHRVRAFVAAGPRPAKRPRLSQSRCGHAAAGGAAGRRIAAHARCHWYCTHCCRRTLSAPRVALLLAQLPYARRLELERRDPAARHASLLGVELLLEGVLRLRGGALDLARLSLSRRTASRCSTAGHGSASHIRQSRVAVALSDRCDLGIDLEECSAARPDRAALRALDCDRSDAQGCRRSGCVTRARCGSTSRSCDRAAARSSPAPARGRPRTRTASRTSRRWSRWREVEVRKRIADSG